TRPQGGFAAVDPAAEDQGAGSALLAWLESRERELHRPVHRQLIASSNATGERLLGAAGYARARSNHTLTRRLDGSAERPPPPPDGLVLRQLDPGTDAAAIPALDAAAFEGQPGYVPESLASFVAEHLASHGFDPALSLIAERLPSAARAPVPIGFLIARRRAREQTGYVDILAVTPAEQGRGVGSALLGAAIAGFARAGLAAVELIVSSRNPDALRLYQRHGLRERHRFDI